MTARGSRSEKVKRIYQRFDTNGDGGLNREEMAALVVAVNPRVKFSEEQINAILDEVFRTYGEFIDGEKGLTFHGLLRTYEDGAGDVDRDFDALGLDIKSLEDDLGISLSLEEAKFSFLVVDEGFIEPHNERRTEAWAASPNHCVVFDDTWKLVDDLAILIRRLKAKQLKDGTIKNDNSDVFSDVGWSRELGQSSEISENRTSWDESRSDYRSFVKKLGVLRSRADRATSREEAFDGQMAIGHVLYEHCLYKEALVSFKRACELLPTDVKTHFRAGNCLHVLGRHNEAKVEFLCALEAAEACGNQWAYLLPQIHINLGIALEGEGMVLCASEHYREAAILCPTHFRALKLLGSALFGVGECKAAVKVLEEAIYMKNDYADAHCDLASALLSLGDDENAIKEFQKAVDLKPRYVDALYNLGGLYMDMGRYQRASEMYVRVLALWPNHWKAQLNKAISLLGAGETEEAKKALKEAFRMTKRVELQDAVSHLKQLQKRRLKWNCNGSGETSFITIEPLKFKTVGEKTTLSSELAVAMNIRSFQRITRLNQCEAEFVKNEMSECNVPVSYSSRGIPEKSIHKASLEGILRKLLSFLKPEAFMGAVKAINQKLLSVLDDSESGRVDLGMFFAVLAPLCGGSLDKRKKIAYESLLWHPVNEGKSQIKKSDAQRYINLLRTIYIEPSHGISDMLEMPRETDESTVSLADFGAMFDDQDSGFSIMSVLLKLETGDRNRHGSHVCATCRYPIIGSRFKEVKLQFSLCGQCYCEGKVPSTCKQEGYRFKEYANEAEAMKDKCLWFGSKGSSSDGS